MRRWRRSGRLLPIIVVLGAAGMLAPTALAADHDVTISGSAFDPPTITIAVGDSVTWANEDALSHTATADDGSFDSGSLGQNATASVVFGLAGSFAYHCEIHSSMTGTVIVEAATPDDQAGGEGDDAGEAGGNAAGITQAPTDAADDVAGRDPGDATRALIAVLLFLAVAMLVGAAIHQRRFRDRTGG